MSSLLKSTIMGLAFVTGIAATAYAQSVSTLPPTSPATAPTAATPPVSSSQIGPNAGNNSTWKEEHYNGGKVADPYSTSIGPQPGNQSSLQGQRYQPTGADNDSARHPYTSNMGPKPN